jgi:hypothetical protein
VTRLQSFGDRRAVALVAAALLLLQATLGICSWIGVDAGHGAVRSERSAHVHVHLLDASHDYGHHAGHGHAHEHEHEHGDPADTPADCCCEGHDHASLMPIAAPLPDLLKVAIVPGPRLPDELSQARRQVVHAARAPPPLPCRPPPGLAELRQTILLI